jgi:hypothetical protein
MKNACAAIVICCLILTSIVVVTTITAIESDREFARRVDEVQLASKSCMEEIDRGTLHGPDCKSYNRLYSAYFRDRAAGAL